MFSSLKKKLQNIRTKFTSNIEEVAGAGVAPPEAEALPAPSGVEDDFAVERSSPPLPGEREEPTFLNKVKILIRDRELLLEAKDIEEPLFELEMILLESDVALPVTDEIIARMRGDRKSVV